SIVSALTHLSALSELPLLRASERSLGLIVVGSGQPYSSREIAKGLGVPVIAEIADDPRAARHLSDGTRRSRRFDSSRLVRSLHSTSSQLAARFETTAELINR
ncbi:MAG: hypothetical protein L0H41_14395, partial [Microlunatus sp.]|nr:hypothetical protein [Microlunatus sp.]